MHAVAREEIAGAPRLIPVHSHRYIPSEPIEAGNPVFSVWQTDIIIFGGDLYEYARNEFRTGENEFHQPARTIPFWSDLVEWNSRRV